MANDGPDAGRRLSFAHTVPPAIVHKSAATEVLLTDAARLGGDRFAVAALWSRDHFLHHWGVGESSDPLLLMETVRQSVIYLSHRFYGVPNGHHFLLSGYEFDTDGLPWGPTPLPVTLDVSCISTTSTGRRFGMVLEASVHIGGRYRGRAGLRWEALSPALYRAVRHGNSVQRSAGWETRMASAGPGTLLPAGDVGQQRAEDVLLSAIPGIPYDAWQLSPNRHHPVLFDHASDHISGVILLEAMRQAAHVTAQRTAVDPEFPWTPTSATATFAAFGEPDAPVTVTARPEPYDRHGPGGGTTVRATAQQNGRTLATAVLRGDALLGAGREALAC